MRNGFQEIPGLAREEASSLPREEGKAPPSLRESVQAYRHHIMREASYLRGLLLTIEGAEVSGLRDNVTIGEVRALLETYRNDYR